MGMADDCTHHDRSKDLSVVWNTELTQLPRAALKSSTESGYLVVQDRQSSKMDTEHYSLELRTG
jgi:hypothetical protein